MGKLKIERLDENDILYWVNIDELRMIYNQIRFGMELKYDGYGKKYEVGGVSQFINRKDLKSKSKTELEMLRRSVREMMKKYYEKYLNLKRQKKISDKSKWEKKLKEVESYIRINENMILGKFLYSLLDFFWHCSNCKQNIGYFYFSKSWHSSNKFITTNVNRYDVLSSE